MRWRILLAGLLLVAAAIACDRGVDEVIVITATFPPPTGATSRATEMPPMPSTVVATAAPSLPAAAAATQTPLTYVVQAGDTLTAIALAHNTTVETLLSLNEITNPDALFEGQTLNLPGRPVQTGPSVPLLPDGLLVRGPASVDFDAIEFATAQPGRLREMREVVDGAEMSGPAIVERVSREFGVDARVLLAMLEYRNRLLTIRDASLEAELYPIFAPISLGDLGRTGLYRQLAWAADRLNAGYYGRKYRRLEILELADGARYLLADGLEPGTAAVQHVFSKMLAEPEWLRAVSPNGFLATYSRLFGNPLTAPPEAPVPANLVQPELELPIGEGETWYFTGGPHGGWGSGSAWAAVDFAPPDDPAEVNGPCYVSAHFVTAAADGVVTWSDGGVVILDLDGDGNEFTGWTVLYLHIASQDRVAEGAVLRAGEEIGRPSCEGGVSNGTHAHFARRYNGEWLPASCMDCTGSATPPPMVLGGWQVVDLPGQEYQGYLVKGDELRIAEAARGVAPNEVQR
ncbi:MAG: LysM peptidoglycan-binding domain-containing protein [Anaerolineae bacterium]|nr:LysM peptidoglycan-binding domain-containing protein [Anaerolineae bacterium]